MGIVRVLGALVAPKDCSKWHAASGLGDLVAYAKPILEVGGLIGRVGWWIFGLAKDHRER